MEQEGMTGRGMRRGWRPLVAGLLLAAATFGVVTGCGETQPAGPTPTAVPPELQAGQKVFLQYCNTCHPGGHQGVGKNLVNAGLTPDKITTTVRHGKRNMPSFSTANISDSDLQSLIGYIQALR
jgi:mono/diheme cytochrome c family protein